MHKRKIFKNDYLEGQIVKAVPNEGLWEIME
jgi:hypothetical protein